MDFEFWIFAHFLFGVFVLDGLGRFEAIHTEDFDSWDPCGTLRLMSNDLI